MDAWLAMGARVGICITVVCAVRARRMRMRLHMMSDVNVAIASHTLGSASWPDGARRWDAHMHVATIVHESAGCVRLRAPSTGDPVLGRRGRFAGSGPLRWL
jgi:hypothetical protein